MSRLERDELYVGIADLFSKRSTCLRGHVGVVIVQDRRPIAGGYNGAPSGLPTCLDRGCEHVRPEPGRTGDPETLLNLYGCQRAIHAETNAIAWCARHGVSVKGAEMYSTHAPCKWCAQLIVAAQIERFVYVKDYRAERLDILDKACIQIVQFKPSRTIDVQCSVT